MGGEGVLSIWVQNGRVLVQNGRGGSAVNLGPEWEGYLSRMGGEGVLSISIFNLLSS